MSHFDDSCIFVLVPLKALMLQNHEYNMHQYKSLYKTILLYVTEEKAFLISPCYMAYMI